jgi:hypothetical protein
MVQRAIEGGKHGKGGGVDGLESIPELGERVRLAWNHACCVSGEGLCMARWYAVQIGKVVREEGKGSA